MGKSRGSLIGHGMWLCAGGGEVIVSDVVNNRIQVFRLDGAFVRQWGTPGGGQGQFRIPCRGVAVSGNDEVFVIDTGNSRIQVFGLDGTFLRKWGTPGAGPGQFKYPRCAAVRGNELVVSDSHNHRIQVFGWDGAFVRQWGVREGGQAPGQFKAPVGVAVSGDQLIVCDINTTFASRCSSETSNSNSRSINSLAF